MKTILRIVLLIFCVQIQAQVGINTTTPAAQLDIAASSQSAPSNTDGILIPRVDAFPAINPTADQQGMILYLMVTSGANLPGLYYWDNITTSWIGISSTANGDKDWYKVGTTTAPYAITDDMFHSGKVGIGSSTPATKLHVMKNSTGMTPNANAITTMEDSGPAYLNILSGNESGILFGANGNATNGGIIYNPPSLPNSMLLRTAGNVNRMIISNDGNIALGSFIPTIPLQFPVSLGDKLSLYGGSGGHYGFGIQTSLMQIHTDFNYSDIAFGYGSSSAFTENMRIKGTGNVGIGTTSPQAKLHIKTAATGMTPNPYSPEIIEGDQLTFLNILSNQESGVVFGSAGTPTSGGVIYSPSSMTKSLQFRTNNNNTRMTISDAGNVGIGSFKADFPLQFESAVGDKISLWGGTGAHSGFGIQNYLMQMYTATSTDDIVFGYGSSSAFTENVRFTGDGFVGIGYNNPTVPLHFASITGDKISLWGTSGPNYGFGIQDYLMQIHTAGSTDDIAFGYGNSSSFTENFRIKGSGNVGIGTSSPSSKLHIFNGSSTITPNGSSLLTVEGSGTNVYTNILSTQETGVLFGASSTSNNGGVIYNSSSYPNSMLFRTGGNTNRMVIGSTGNVAIGNFSANYPLQFPSTLGDKICLYDSGATNYGIGIQGNLMQIHSDLSGSDIAFGYGSSASFTERVRIKGTGKVGIGTTTPTTELEVNGYTKLGTTAPGVKMIKLTGTTASTQGTTTAILHGLTSSKILAVNVLVEYSSGNSVPPSYNGSSGYEYDYFVTSVSVTVWPKSGNSANILSKPIRILVTYEE